MSAVRKKRDPVATRNQILNAAGRLLAEGDGQLEMSCVAREAGVSQGLAYHHFGSKDGLIAAVVDDFYDRLDREVLMSRLDEIEDWREREEERTRRYIHFLLDDPLGRLISGRLSQSPMAAIVEANRWQQLIGVGARNIAQGQAEGAVGAREDGELLAAMTLGAIRAGVARALAGGATVDRVQLAKDSWAVLQRSMQLSKGESP